MARSWHLLLLMWARGNNAAPNLHHPSPSPLSLLRPKRLCCSQSPPWCQCCPHTLDTPRFHLPFPSPKLSATLSHSPRGIPTHVAHAALDRQDSDAAHTLAPHTHLPPHTLSPHSHSARGIPAHVASAALDRQDTNAARTLTAPPNFPPHTQTLSPHSHSPRGIPSHVASAALDRQDSDAARTLATPLFSSCPAAAAPASDTAPRAAPCLSTAVGPFRLACSRRCRLGLGCGKYGALGDGHQVSAGKVGNSGPGQLSWWVPLVEVPQPSSHAVLLQSVN